MPALFVSHGTPMLALAEDRFTEALRAFCRQIEKPRAIVVVSAHGTSSDDQLVEVTAGKRSTLIYDFVGFPSALYQMEYPCPGDPELAMRIAGLLGEAGFQAQLTAQNRLDHGVWIPLRVAFPEADIPVVQVTVPASAGPRHVLKLGKALSSLRGEGILLVGSGGAVHNLQKLKWYLKDGAGAEWAQQFEAWVKEQLKTKNVEALVEFEENGPQARLAHPTAEHFYPLLFTIGSAWLGDEAVSIFEGIQYDSLSMLTFAMIPAGQVMSPSSVLH